MNQIQNNYCMAKAICDTLSEQQAENEFRFMQEIGITNPDGTTPKRLYMLTLSEEELDRICEEFDFSEYDLFDEMIDAEKQLRVAEDQLIDFAISIVQQPERDILDINRNRIRIREKLIDLAMKLDTRTMKGVKCV